MSVSDLARLGVNSSMRRYFSNAKSAIAEKHKPYSNLKTWVSGQMNDLSRYPKDLEAARWLQKLTVLSVSIRNGNILSRSHKDVVSIREGVELFLAAHAKQKTGRSVSFCGRGRHCGSEERTFRPRATSFIG